MSIHDAEYDLEYAQMYEKSSKNKVYPLYWKKENNSYIGKSVL